MKSASRLIALTALLTCFAAASNAHAQNMYGSSYGNGYGFAMGYGNNNWPGCNNGFANHPFAPFSVGNFGFDRPAEEPPYFAKFPPVYYSNIVRRPYGISPYAAPPGIMPVEMMAPEVEREVVKNPYVEQPLQPAPDVQATPDANPTPLIKKKAKDKK